MNDQADPKLIDALERIFATRNDIKLIAQYEQKLYESVEALNVNHKAVHDHVRDLTNSHNDVREDTNKLLQLKGDLTGALRELTDSHRQTRKQMTEALNAISYIQQEARKIPQLERRLEQIERELAKLWQEDRRDEKQDAEQEARLRRLERK